MAKNRTRSTKSANPNQTRSTRPRASRAKKTAEPRMTETVTETETVTADEVGDENEVAANEVASVESTGTETTEAAAAAGSNDTMNQATFQLKKVSKNGQFVLYEMRGLPGSIRFSRAMFAGEPPAELPINAEFVEPREIKSKAKKVLTPEEQAAEAQRIQDRLKAQQAKAEKAAARAQKAQERLAKLQAKAGVASATETAEATA